MTSSYMAAFDPVHETNLCEQTDHVNANLIANSFRSNYDSSSNVNDRNSTAQSTERNHLIHNPLIAKDLPPAYSDIVK